MEALRQVDCMEGYWASLWEGGNVTCTHCCITCLISAQTNWISIIDQIASLANGYGSIYLMREA